MFTLAGSSVLVLEGFQYTGFRSGAPPTRKVYCGTAGTLFAAGQSTLSGQGSTSRKETTSQGPMEATEHLMPAKHAV